MTYHAIAIDGPAASGKSTLAQTLAERLGLVMVNSGAMYRAVTWKILTEQVDPADTESVIRLLNITDIRCGHEGNVSTIRIDGIDPSPFLRKPEINANVSTISAIPQVRDRLVALQRDYLNRTHVVMEGRDIGSVVFPNTAYKIYIDADPSVRDARRSDDGEIDSVSKRDADDSSRKTAPLMVADGAAILDTSDLDVSGVVAAAIQILGRQGFPMPQNAPILPNEEPSTPMRWIYWLGWMSFGAAYRTLFGLRIIGDENLIKAGPVLIASNHQSFLDPPLIGNLYKTEIVYFARKTLFSGIGAWFYPQWNAIPIDQEKPDTSSMKSAIRKLKEGWRVLVFPEGQRTFDGKISEAAPGIGMIAAKAGVPIQPVRIFGAYKALPRGSGKISLSRITVKVGPPILLSAEEFKVYSNKEGYLALTERIMMAIKAL